MKGKILIILGVFIVIGAFMAYFLLEATIVRERKSDPIRVLAAKTDIPEGTVVRTLEQANNLFRTIEVYREHVVATAVLVTEKREQPVAKNLLDEILLYLFPVTERPLELQNIEGLVNKRLTRSYRKNEQILAAYVSDEFLDLDKPTRYFAIPVDFIDSVAGQIRRGDFVDLWIRYDDTETPDVESFIVGRKAAEKLLGPHEVVLTKSDDGKVITNEAPGVPDAIVLKMSEEEIEKVVEMMTQGTIFFTMHRK